MFYKRVQKQSQRVPEKKEWFFYTLFSLLSGVILVVAFSLFFQVVRIRFPFGVDTLFFALLISLGFVLFTVNEQIFLKFYRKWNSHGQG